MLGQACAVVLVLALHGQEAAPIRVPVRLVLVPTLVFSAKGQIVSGLEARDFALFDNGLRQTIRLQSDASPPSIAIAIQTNPAVSDYLPFVKKTGALLDSLLVGEGGRAAVLTYSDDVRIVKNFRGGDTSDAMKKLEVHGSGSRMVDAGMQAVDLLRQEEISRQRVLLFIGQADDGGSKTGLEALREKAARENVIVHCLALPMAGKKFVAETFSLQGKDGSGFEASADLMKLVPSLRKTARQAAGEDPFSVLATATGGTQIHFRRQEQLENGLIAMGAAIRSSYLLSYSPSSEEPGYHRLSVAVDAAQDKVYSRPGYWRQAE